ncbi:alkaline phosphatase family protein [Rhodoluna sp.]|jgi:predicted AlkP superfamily pyrophosphatase or phosphodiesterase|uniref:alkaline phosphatase family protein n=1 Tax=Rhodoluna sp. TaxID=1969481 RepID=UPI0025E046DB|nr:alkaline phosphatase family protein [Rhodoluna sp.]
MSSMLPALPKSFGRLSDVFASALGAITGVDNRLGLRRVEQSVVVLVDGLGVSNLNYRSGHAPFLTRSVGTKISTVFPSTTAAAIASFSTGLLPGRHGLVGYQIFDRDKNQSVNLLTGLGADFSPEQFQPNQTISERATEAGVPCFVVGPAEYENSGYSNATMRLTTYLAAKTLDDRVRSTLAVLDKNPKALVYLYVPELDQTAHAFGSQSFKWLEKLEELDGAIQELQHRLPKKAGMLLTADHGIVDVDPNQHIFLDEAPGLENLVAVGGDPRCQFLYFQEAISEKQISELKSWLTDRCLVATKEEISNAGWYGTLTHEASGRLPDLFIIAISRVALYHRDFARKKSMQMIGQHGSISPEELSVPLLRFGAFI